MWGHQFNFNCTTILILQAYLSDSEFQTVFGMTKDAFYQQPNWKQELQKRKADLFWREQASYLVSAIKFDPLIVNGGPTGVNLSYIASHASFWGQATGGFAQLVFFLQPIL